MIQKIKCFFGSHSIFLQTHQSALDNSLHQRVLCRHCNKEFVYVKWENVSGEIVFRDGSN